MRHEVAEGPCTANRFRGFAPRGILRATLFACFALVAAFSSPAPARAWGCQAHQIIALLAEKHLTPHALATVQEILNSNPINPDMKRICKERSLDAMADSSTWADDIRAQRPETSPWHYINIRFGATLRGAGKDVDEVVEKFCDPRESCLTHATAEQFAILRSAETDPRKKADALRFVIHFVGDLHQPLHNSTNNDQGGNCVPVNYFGALPQLRNPRTETYLPNLHGLWDYDILARATTGKTAEQAAADLDQSYRRKIAGWQKGPADIEAWSWESFQLAVTKVYGKLPVRIPAEVPQPVKSCVDDNHVSARMLKLNERIGEPYQKMAVPAIRERLAQAGARLAMLLNELWP